MQHGWHAVGEDRFGRNLWMIVMENIHLVPEAGVEAEQRLGPSLEVDQAKRPRLQRYAGHDQGCTRHQQGIVVDRGMEAWQKKAGLAHQVSGSSDQRGA